MDHKKIKTGQDMINAGVNPKTAPEMLALITEKRLKAVRDKILAGLTDEMLGVWLPAFREKEEKVTKKISQAQAQTLLTPGTRVIGVSTYEKAKIDGIEGTVRSYDNAGRIGVEWDRSEPQFHNLSGLLKANNGYWVTCENVVLANEPSTPVKTRVLNDDVIAANKTGHLVRLNHDYVGILEKSDAGYYDPKEVQVNLPKGTLATLTKFDRKNLKLELRLKSDGNDEKAKKHTIKLKGLDDPVFQYLEASSLGQIEPKDKELEVKKKTLVDFFPQTVFDHAKAERIIIGMLMGRDMIFHGPPGGGKSSVAKDIMRIFAQQEYLFTVDGCQVQCNPYSLFDEKHAKKVDACPACKIQYDPDFAKTGFFTRPKPEDVKVVVKKFGDGVGFEFMEGTIGLTRTHLAGFKLPKLDGTTDDEHESNSSPVGYKPGCLPRTNNGLLIMEEGDKLRPQALDDTLIALEDNVIKPDDLRFPYPANAIILMTANDATKFSDAINDRMLMISIRYPTDPETCQAILKRSYHSLFEPAKNTPLEAIHEDRGNNFRKIPIPETIENAVASMYIKFRAEYNGPGLNLVSGSGRSVNDACDAARASWLIDTFFYKDAPAIVDAEYMMKGASYALAARVHETDGQKNLEAKHALGKWVWDTFPEILKSEENAWWCNVRKTMAVLGTAVPEIPDNFTAELTQYGQDITNAVLSYQAVKKAYDNQKDKRAQLALIEKPFMNYLFKNQPAFSSISEKQLVGTIQYYLTSLKGSIVEAAKE